MTQTDIRPWYREPWPWIVMGSLGFVVLATIATLVISIVYYDGLVADDYYKKGLEINKTLVRKERSVALGLNAVLTIQPDDTLQIVLKSKDRSFAPPEELHLYLAHHRFSKHDIEMTLKHDKHGVYTGRLASPSEGGWKIVLEGDDWRFPELKVQAPITEVRWESSETVKDDS